MIFMGVPVGRIENICEQEMKREEEKAGGRVGGGRLGEGDQTESGQEGQDKE